VLGSQDKMWTLQHTAGFRAQPRSGQRHHQDEARRRAMTFKADAHAAALDDQPHAPCPRLTKAPCKGARIRRHVKDDGKWRPIIVADQRRTVEETAFRARRQTDEERGPGGTQGPVKYHRRAVEPDCRGCLRWSRCKEA
jgi:hypothetical protein